MRPMGSHSTADCMRAGVVAGVGGGGQDHNTGFALFQFEIELTVEGLNAAPGMGLAVAQILFDYIAMLKKAGPQAWIWEEMKGLNDCSFRCDHTGHDCPSLCDLSASCHARR